MNFDFSALLVLLTFLSGFIWAIDTLFFTAKRKLKAVSGDSDRETAKEPILVEYPRSFFPILFIVLILRSFIVEPFRIPSGSMMPTLLIGDFILVNKYDYGIRLPVVHSKIIANNGNGPQRGDVVVFRYPEDPSIHFIKRVIGLPGDRVEYTDKKIYINNLPMEQAIKGEYIGIGAGKMMDGASLREENLGEVQHEILVNSYRFSGSFEHIVPKGHYFVLGDNRDNSKDSRYWGFVPGENLIGRAFFIWLNWDWKNGGISWKRIGSVL